MSLDPLNRMNEYFKDKEYKSKHKHSNKHKKHKHQDSTEPKIKPQTSETMDQLQTEIMKRDTLEKKKKEALMAKMRGEKLREDTSD